MTCVHRLNIFFVNDDRQILWDIGLAFSLCQMQLFTFVVRKPISQVQLHLAGLASIITVFSTNDGIRDVLGNLIFEKLVELGAFYLIINWLFEH